MKKLLAVIMVVIISMGILVGCGNGSNKDAFKIGVIQFGEFDALDNAYNGFLEGLKEAGYKDGEKIKINFQTAAADMANCPTIADSLINDGSDLIFAIATPSATAVKEKTTTIPILFTAVTDPVKSELIESMEKPGGNVTGTSDLNPVEQQIKLIKEIIPNVKNVAVLYCSSESNSYIQYEMAEKEIKAQGMNCIQKTISEVSELKSAIESLKGEVEAIYVPTDNTIADAMETASSAATEVKIPIFPGESGMVRDGGLATHGLDYFQLGKQTAKMAVDIIENGKKPADIPVEVQDIDTLEISVNMDVAKALGITIPEEILEKATKYPKDN